VGNLYDYFAAPDDATAASCLDGGPGAVGFDTVDVKGMDPYVQLGQGEALLVDLPFDEVRTHPRFNHLITDVAAESCWVVTLTDRLRDALAQASPERLAEVSVPWSRIEEFAPGADPALLADFLDRFAALARRARAAGHGLYCWISL
jgi:hypothetical protein